MPFLYQADLSEGSALGIEDEAPDRISNLQVGAGTQPGQALFEGLLEILEGAHRPRGRSAVDGQSRR